MSYRTLKARIARYDRRMRHRRAFAPVMIAIHPEDDSRAIVGAFGAHGDCIRFFDEPLPTFVKRASGEIGQRLFCAKYLAG